MTEQVLVFIGMPILMLLIALSVAAWATHVARKGHRERLAAETLQSGPATPGRQDRQA
jgi:hypothetical protein